MPKFPFEWAKYTNTFILNEHNEYKVRETCITSLKGLENVLIDVWCIPMQVKWNTLLAVIVISIQNVYRFNFLSIHCTVFLWTVNQSYIFVHVHGDKWEYMSLKSVNSKIRNCEMTNEWVFVLMSEYYHDQLNLVTSV